MNFQEYKKWWEENKNYEEEMAPVIIEEICKMHEIDIDKVQIYPRKVINTENGRIEFDLLIKYQDGWKREKLIAIEFKEENFRKAIHQAVIRREYVDYIYVAVIPPILSYEYADFFVMLCYGIGLVVWNCENAMIIFKSAYQYPSEYRIKEVIGKLSAVMVQKVLSELEKEKYKTLEKFG